MKKTICLPVLFAIGILFFSCGKNTPFLNPLTRGCQVSEYHDPLFDFYFPPHLPSYLFKKTFDPSGRILKEIECYFNDDTSPSLITSSLYHHIFRVAQQGRMIFLINKYILTKDNTPDTVARITVDGNGRALSCQANGELNPDISNNPSQTEIYIYHNDRIFAVQNNYTGVSTVPPYLPIAFTRVDTIHYDRYGNVSSFLDKVYQYDYTKKAKQQFYADDYIPTDEPFYLLQYLGFFPEFNSPPNIRIHSEDEVRRSDITGHQFDAEGKLIGFSAFGTMTSITWNCK